MIYRGRLQQLKHDEMTLKLNRNYELNGLERYKHKDGHIYHDVKILDPRMISYEQRGLIFSLIRDIADWTGYTADYIEALFKTQYKLLNGLDMFSLSNIACTLVQASEFIELLLEHCLEHGIPFKFQEFHLASDISRILFLYIKHRICFVCGKEHSDIAHYDSVGMGNNRHKTDHSKKRLMCLCREHHIEQHTMPIQDFTRKYHIAPIKLNTEQLVSLGIQKKGAIE